MTSLLETGHRWGGVGVMIVALIGTALIADQTPAMALVNESPSLPRGVYIRPPSAPISVGSECPATCC